MRRPPTSRLLPVVAALIALVAVASLMAEAIGTKPRADTLAAYGYDDPPTRVDVERPTQAAGTQEQALRSHAAPSGDREQRYDDRANFARAPARQVAYRLAPRSTPGTAIRQVGRHLESVDDVFTNPHLLAGRNPAELRAICWTQIRVPGGTTFYEGAAAAQRGLVGGGNQVFLPWVDNAWVVRSGGF